MKQVPWAPAVVWLGVACRAGAPPAIGNEPDIASTRRSCDELAGLTAYDYSINSARLVPASEDLPEYCQVTGQILPEVAFELRLPTRWNRRFLMLGNGGLAGMITGDLGGAVKQYFAVAGTNTGHRAPPAFEQAARFATDRQQLIDYGYRAVHVTTLTAKEIARSYYDAPLAFSYFSGCSTGGRQGLMSAQRFPDDFDGILVGAPVLYHVGQVISDAWIQKALRNAPADLHLLADRVYAACDSVDGLADGLIDDPRRCPFEPSRDLPICRASAAGSDCYTEEQIHALAGFYEDVVAGGERLAPGYPVGSEVFVTFAALQREASGWLGWRVGVDKPFGVAITETILRYLAFEQPDPEFDVFAFDFDRDPARMAWLRPLVDATSPDLGPFRARGGKLLMYFGWADPMLNPLRGIEYYESVMDEMGAAVPDFFRLFMVPGMFHCAGGVGVDSVAWLPTLAEWVEHAVAPERIVGTRTGVTPRPGADAIGRTRPLCPYPQVARYGGQGSIDDAANFVCANPDVP